MKALKPMLPFLGVMLAAFYLAPLFIRDTGSAMLVLLIAVPLICLACSLFYGLKKDFSWLFPLILAVLFVPSIFIFYNESAWVYTFAYGGISLLGCAVGRICARRG